jgi:hypothetical protein
MSFSGETLADGRAPKRITSLAPGVHRDATARQTSASAETNAA